MLFLSSFDLSLNIKNHLSDSIIIVCADKKDNFSSMTCDFVYWMTRAVCCTTSVLDFECRMISNFYHTTSYTLQACFLPELVNPFFSKYRVYDVLQHRYNLETWCLIPCHIKTLYVLKPDSWPCCEVKWNLAYTREWIDKIN